MHISLSTPPPLHHVCPFDLALDIESSPKELLLGLEPYILAWCRWENSGARKGINPSLLVLLDAFQP